MMNYYEYTFTLNSPIDKEIVRDILAAELGEIGFESFIETETGLTGYIQESKHNEEELERKLAQFPLENTEITFRKEYIVSKDWNEEWEKNYFQPITVNDECIIHASFHPIEKTYTYDIIIDPKMAFGTGNHETTWLMISEMLQMDLKGKELLDMGCGTAVLAILAAKKGAQRVVAIDIDEWAYLNALENVELNHTTDIQVALGGAERIKDFGKFDFIFANINRNILLQDMKSYATAMKQDALLLMSGFYKEDISVLEEECKNNQLVLLSFSEKNNWVAVKTMINS